jgi:hypothetical protein
MHNPNLIELKAADHPVQAVTIFSSARSGYGMAGKAEVIRNFSIELKVRSFIGSFYRYRTETVTSRTARTGYTSTGCLATLTSIPFAYQAWMIASAFSTWFALSSSSVTPLKVI